MKTYEDEKEELLEWCNNALNEANIKIANLPNKEGRDDRGTAIRFEVMQEYNRRFILLKEKHNKELTQRQVELKRINNW